MACLFFVGSGCLPARHQLSLELEAATRAPIRFLYQKEKEGEEADHEESKNRGDYRPGGDAPLDHVERAASRADRALKPRRRGRGPGLGGSRRMIALKAGFRRRDRGNVARSRIG